MEETATEVLSILKTTIEEFYKNEKDYFSFVRGRERSIVFRIAHKLADKIENEIKLAENNELIFVDIETNRCNGKIKRNSIGDIIRPDLCVHKRNGTGYLVAEFKCCNTSSVNDFTKLELLTLPKEKYTNLNRCCPSYQLGVFVRLKDNEVQLITFKDGKEVGREVVKYN